MNLVVDNTGENTSGRVYLFEEGLKELVFEPKPIQRFQFKEQKKIPLSANRPVCGIVFEGKPFIGTNDGFIYSSDSLIQRIPDILVDEEIFIDNYPFENELQRDKFGEFLSDTELINLRNYPNIYELIQINRLYQDVQNQFNNIYNYLNGALSIKGFVIHKKTDEAFPRLYDGSEIGIFDTFMGGKAINNLQVQAMSQVTPSIAGFVPNNHTIFIENGIIKWDKVNCVDVTSLWDLKGNYKYAIRICPRDGSGGKAAKFVIDGEIAACFHGNHPFYSLDISSLDISSLERGYNKLTKSIQLDSTELPDNLRIYKDHVIGSKEKILFDYTTSKIIFDSKEGYISSISDLGDLFSVFDKENTRFYDISNQKEVASLKGEYKFLSATPQ